LNTVLLPSVTMVSLFHMRKPYLGFLWDRVYEVKHVFSVRISSYVTCIQNEKVFTSTIDTIRCNNRKDYYSEKRAVYHGESGEIGKFNFPHLTHNFLVTGKSMHKTAMILGVILPLDSHSMADQGTRLRVTVSPRSIHALKQLSEAGDKGKT
jgi:hypothetical protein